MAGDLTDILGRLLALEAENQRLWKALNKALHDNDQALKRLNVIEAWLAAEDDDEAGLNETEVKLQQAAFLISEAMKRLENENVPAAYASLKSAIEWIDQPTVDEQEGIQYSK